jgi:menaquinone-dependent protoporphyrinogen oxidase
VSRILVAFATRAGSTREVAAAIAPTWRNAAIPSSLDVPGDVREPVWRWDCVVLGAPIYSGRWHRHAHRFLKRHRRELGDVPVAVFGMGPRAPEAEAWLRSRRQLDRALAKRDWLTPAVVAVFGGVDPPNRSRVLKRDMRDWVAVKARGPAGVWPRFPSLSSRSSRMTPAPKGRRALVRRVTSSAGATAASPGRFARSLVRRTAP